MLVFQKNNKKIILLISDKISVFYLYPIFDSQNVQKKTTVDTIFRSNPEFRFKSRVNSKFESEVLIHFYFFWVIRIPSSLLFLVRKLI